eukprot:TRINITY_DN6070_c0_g1_i1.p1 TRINITY_DN6070_c0_g1~~TRINITY_DN6070_c0_g1_i1.p1  ORF type:complete len:353 (+),score=51.46 TRINITY_DN6070_c0_g1_i1:318-1376(+)
MLKVRVSQASDSSSDGVSTSQSKPNLASSMFGRRVSVDDSTSKPTPRDAGVQVSHPRYKKCSILTTNYRGFLTLARKQGGRLPEWYGQEVFHFHEACNKTKGVVDLISGDHFQASFNASKPCASFRGAAVRCGDMLRTQHPGGPLQLCASICSGEAICGDVGTNQLRRFMIVGGLQSLLFLTDKLLKCWTASLVADQRTYNDVSFDWSAQLLCSVSFDKWKCGVPSLLYSVREKRGRDSREGEWLYHIQAENGWQTHNKIAMMWLEHNVSEAVSLANQFCEAATADKEVLDAVAALRDTMEEEPMAAPNFIGLEASVTPSEEPYGRGEWQCRTPRYLAAALSVRSQPLSLGV